MSEVKCFNCRGFGVYDAGYHDPRECPCCDGSGILRIDNNGKYRKYNGRFV